MRPALTPIRLGQMPRWRRHRAADLRMIAAVYSSGAALVVLTTAAICFAPHGLARRQPDFNAWVLIAFLGIVYLLAGGMVVAFAVRRLAFWHGQLVLRQGSGQFLTVATWPIAIAAMLLRAALVS